MEEVRNSSKILTRKPIEKRPLERPKRRRENYIRMDVKEIIIKSRNWADSVRDTDYCRALVNVILDLWVP